jgi:predicted metal-dependent peptidase
MAELRHRGTRAIQHLVEFAPSTGGLALWVQHVDRAEPTAPPLATDGLTLFYGPGFDALPLPQQAGLVAHQVLHVALRHPARFLALQARVGDVDLPLFNICADAIVNSSLAPLDWLQLPPGAVNLPRLLAATLDETTTDGAALLVWDVESLYRQLDDRLPPERDKQRDGKRRDPKPDKADGRHAGRGGPTRPDGPRAAQARAVGAAQAHDLLPDPTHAGPPEAEAEATREWRERLQRAHAGDGAFSLLRALGADLPQVKTPWEQLLRSQVARALAPRPALSWSRPSRSYIARQGRSAPGRRLPWEPGTSGSRPVPRLVLVVDVSGSIGDSLLQRFSRELDALVRRLGAGLTLVVGDDRVQSVSRFEPGDRRRGDLAAISFQGGGGTDFTPLLEEASRHAPDLVVVLTDLQGPARHRPPCPVLWVVPAAFGDAQAPFGRVLVLD